MDILENNFFSRYFTIEFLHETIQIVLILVIGFLFVRLLNFVVRRSITRNASDQAKAIFHKIITYGGWALITLLVLSELGLRLSALLGAAGVVGIAVGIASQKSLGNIISGFFLMSDKTFEVGDVISVGTKTGVVHSLDLLSIKLRTFDNTLIRIPNDSIISTEITNITRFPIRRMDFKLQVAYKESLPKVKQLLFEAARANPLCLDEPEPFLLFKEFGASGVELQFAVWFEKSDYVSVKNSVFEDIKQSFDKAGIEIPFQHITLYAGSDTRPLPIRHFAAP
ncbi:MAG: mechanosensitive ion channel family protein [Spirochaetaceae bacterium]|nr:mechanosensitive ion channel family protein [Spirochaetaceae bacterium]MCF7950430.1 mechanosensitive ion channel family protein [Spirochaetaceae bacterium]